MKNAILVGAAVLAASTWSASALAGRADDTMNWATDREVAIVDPYYNNVRELVVMGHLGWDGLLFRNLETGGFEPLLATAWNWVDNVTLDVDLREGVTFHDGSTFGPEDVVYTINHVSSPDSGVLSSRIVSWMKSAEALGPNQVRIHLNGPFPAALAYLSNAVFMVPEGHYDDAPMTADGKKDYGAVSPVGTGPLPVRGVQARRVRAVDQERGLLRRQPQGQARHREHPVPHHQGDEHPDRGAPHRGLDWIWDVPKDQAERLADQGSVTVENAKTMRVSYLAFDVDGDSGQTFFTDKRVREAVARAIDRESLTRNMVGPASVVIHSACHPDQFGCAQDVPRWDHDPERAKALLAEAGFADGFEFDIYAYRQREYTEAVIGDLAKVGIKAKLTYMQYRALRDLVWKGETPINHMTWGLVLHPRRLRDHEPLLLRRAGRPRQGRGSDRLARGRRHLHRPGGPQGGLREGSRTDLGGALLAADVHVRQVLRVLEGPRLPRDLGRDPPLLRHQVEVISPAD